MPNPNRVAAGKSLAAQRFPHTCPHCGVAFDGTRKQIYCSRSCKEAAAKIDRSGKTCPVCSSKVTDEEKERIKGAALAHGISEGELIRRAVIAMWLL